MTGPQILDVCQGFGGNAFACRAIVTRQWLPTLSRPSSASSVYTSHPRQDMLLFTQVVSTDSRELERVGWSVVQMQCGETTPVAYEYGPLEGTIHIVGRAELYAIVHALENCLAPIVITTDHLNHVKKIAKGEKQCRSLLLSPHIDLWDRVWDQINRLGGYGEAVSIVYIPAHGKIKPGICQSVIEDIVGNDQADKYSNMGRDSHAVDGQTLK